MTKEMLKATGKSRLYDDVEQGITGIPCPISLCPMTCPMSPGLSSPTALNPMVNPWSNRLKRLIVRAQTDLDVSPI